MNATATRTRKPEARSAKVQTIGDAVILWLTVGANVTAYRVTAVPHAYGKAAFHLAKADKGDGQPDEYDVLLDGQFSSCECKGFLRHGMKAAGGSGCKHVAGCQAALASGQLKAAAAASKPAPVPCELEDLQPHNRESESPCSPPTEERTMTEICGYCGGRGFVLGSLYDAYGFQCFVEPPQVTCEYCGGFGQCEDGGLLLPAVELSTEQHSADRPRWA